MARIGVIGAGLAGLVVARELTTDHDVTVFEKSRGVSGRMATRRIEGYEFDHGTQFFTVKSPEFNEFLQPLISAGVVTAWRAIFAEMERGQVVRTRQWDDTRPHYVGVPGMSAICGWLASDLDVQLQCRVTKLQQDSKQWQLTDDKGAELGRFDWVVITAPAAQTTALLPPDCSIRQYSEPAKMLGCYSLMIADPRPLSLPWEAALVRDADISWISVNSSKPGRGGGYSLLAHSMNDWANLHLDADQDWVLQHLFAETSAVLGVDTRAAAHSSLHRWRYANIDTHETPGFGVDENLRLAACGDWFLRGRVEAAFTSATRLSDELGRLIK